MLLIEWYYIYHLLIANAVSSVLFIAIEHISDRKMKFWQKFWVFIHCVGAMLMIGIINAPR